LSTGSEQPGKAQCETLIRSSCCIHPTPSADRRGPPGVGGPPRLRASRGQNSGKSKKCTAARVRVGARPKTGAPPSRRPAEVPGNDRRARAAAVPWFRGPIVGRTETVTQTPRGCWRYGGGPLRRRCCCGSRSGSGNRCTATAKALSSRVILKCQLAVATIFATDPARSSPLVPNR
jgi:hypothetical protein